MYICTYVWIRNTCISANIYLNLGLLHWPVIGIHSTARRGKALSRAVRLQLSSQWVAAPQYWKGKTCSEGEMSSTSLVQPEDVSGFSHHTALLRTLQGVLLPPHPRHRPSPSDAGGGSLGSRWQLQGSYTRARELRGRGPVLTTELRHFLPKANSTRL